MNRKHVGAVLELPFKLIDGLISPIMYGSEKAERPSGHLARYWFDRAMYLERMLKDAKYRYQKAARDQEREHKREIERLKREKDRNR